ncbi:hypothetical protein I316_04704 [Kwoniella heveanensis BCC8398]|uniref:Uncharacterized protein n=1 Tax=Kwoniella heveanensis BCC8398 TaxID=1296120 RepID=A0A1B9GRD1_9TREE|nr:hypothetical protein I316_04704 [Kwoniella heveanensis BCC8398]
MSTPQSPLYETEKGNVDVKVGLIDTDHGKTVRLTAKHRWPGKGEWEPLRIEGVDLLSGRFDTGSKPDDTTSRMGEHETIRRPPLEIQEFSSNIEPLTNAFMSSKDQLAKLLDRLDQKRRQTKQRVNFLESKIGSNDNCGIDTVSLYGGKLAELQAEFDKLNRETIVPMHGIIARDKASSEVVGLYESAMTSIATPAQKSVRKLMEEDKRVLQDLASTICPEDRHIVHDVVEAQIDMMDEMFAATSATINRQCATVASSALFLKDDKLRPEVACTYYIAVADKYSEIATHYSEQRDARGGSYKKKYGKYHETKGFPITQEHWKDIWTSPRYQVGQVRLHSTLNHPSNHPEDREKAVLSQYPEFSCDGGTTWQPIESDGSVPPEGPHLEEPEISAWHLMHPNVKLSDTFDLESWRKALESVSKTLADTAVGSSEADSKAGSLKPTREQGESRAAFVDRVRRHEGANLTLTQGIIEGETLWTDALQKRRNAFGKYLGRVSQRANPTTEEQRSLIDQWEQILHKTLDRDEADFLSKTHRLLSEHTKGEVQSEHLTQSKRYQEDSQAADTDRSRTQAALSSQLQQIYGSSQVPTGGLSWEWRFFPENSGCTKIPDDVIEAEAPMYLRVRDALKRMDPSSVEYTRADGKSGGVPEAVQETLGALATGSTVTASSATRDKAKHLSFTTASEL